MGWDLADVKTTQSYFLGPTSLDIIMRNCQNYDDNIGPKLKYPSFALLGA